MWPEVREKLLSAGAAFAQLLDDDLADADVRRRFRFDVRTRAPQQREAYVGGELWALLSGYRLRQIRGPDAWGRENNALAMIAMIVEEIIAIDDMDPRDVFGYPNEI
jgi:hypothetical protein